MALQRTGSRTIGTSKLNADTAPGERAAEHGLTGDDERRTLVGGHGGR